jgi:hypothetical protein
MRDSLDAEFLRLLEQVGYTASRDSDAWWIANEGGELRYAIRITDGEAELSFAERDDPARILLVSTDFDDALRLVAQLIGEAYRASEDLRPVDLPFTWDDVAPGYRVTEPRNGWVTLESTDGKGRVYLMDREIVHPAIEFSYVADAEPTSVIRSYISPDGSPVLTDYVRVA